MSLTLNMVGGGGGGLSATDALLRVQAPAQSTVTITKGGVTKSDAGHENADDHSVYDYYFIIHQSQFDSVNAWTVTATLGTSTASKTIIINAADEYDVVIEYELYLIRSGVQVVTDWTKSNSSNNISTQDDAQRFSVGATSIAGVFTATNAIDLTNFSTLSLTVKQGNSYFSTGKSPLVGVGISRPTGGSSASSITNFDTYTAMVGGSSGNYHSITADTYTVDISSLTGNYYIGLSLVSVSNGIASVDITEWKLMV